MRNCLKTIISISAVVSVLGLNSSVFGVAAFARQTGLDCTSCHASAGFPTLNTFGQAFKAGGYINGDDANMMGDGEALSIPKTLNMSVIAKIRENYQIANETGDGAGEMAHDVPDELAFMLGGRISKNMGYLMELNLVHVGVANLRAPIVFDVGPGKLGVVVWLTDGLGPAFAFDVAATGSTQNSRAFENLKGAAAEQGNFANASYGLGAYYKHELFYVTYSPYMALDNAMSTNGNADVLDNGNTHEQAAHYARVAITPNVAGLDLLVGGEMFYGKVGSTLGGATLTQSRSAIDAQVQGTLGVPVLAWFQYATQGAADLQDAVAYNNYATDAANAGASLDAVRSGMAGSVGAVTSIRFGVDAQIIENKANVGVGYSQDTVEKGSAASVAPLGASSIVLAGKYNIARNMRVNLEYVKSLTAYDATKQGGSDASKIQAMLFGSW